MSPSTKATSATLRPLDVAMYVRAPAQYLKTRVYYDSIAEEAVFLLGEWSECFSNSIAFPEMTVPVVSILKRSIKKSNNAANTPKSSKSKNKSAPGKTVQQVKSLVEKLEDGSRWIEERRTKTVDFAPNSNSSIKEWEKNVRIEDTPVGKWMKILRKARDRKREMMEKVC